jgi:RNase P/RNase MRP subunit p29
MYQVNLVDKPFIGNTLSVREAANAHYVGITGTVVDETKYAFRVQTHLGEEKLILKKGTVFLINGKLIPGRDIEKRLEDRIKNRRSK